MDLRDYLLTQWTLLELPLQCLSNAIEVVVVAAVEAGHLPGLLFETYCTNVAIVFLRLEMKVFLRDLSLYEHD